MENTDISDIKPDLGHGNKRKLKEDAWTGTGVVNTSNLREVLMHLKTSRFEIGGVLSGKVYIARSNFNLIKWIHDITYISRLFFESSFQK